MWFLKKKEQHKYPYIDYKRSFMVQARTPHAFSAPEAGVAVVEMDTVDAIIISFSPEESYVKFFPKEKKSTLFHRNTIDREFYSIPRRIFRPWLVGNGYQPFYG